MGIIAVIILGFSMIILPRRHAVIPMLLMVCFIASAQRVVILTLDFDLLRIMVIFGWIRLFVRREINGLKWRTLDIAIIAWSISGTLAMVLLYMKSWAIIYRLGFMYDVVGMYFLFRFLIRDWRDVEIIAISAACISIPVVAAFLLEKSTGRNVFSIFGGVPAVTLIRNGSLRCQGAYSHPILAGAFWASLLPLILALLFRSDWKRMLAIVGIVCTIMIIIASASSTPLMAMMIGITAMGCYLLRNMMRLLRWGAVLGLVLLQISMNHPIWHLLTRIDLANGSTGWYRYKLIDDFIRHFSDWWLMGTKSMLAWRQWGSDDVTNQYVREGVTGGIMTLVLFMVIIMLAFRGVRRFEFIHGHGWSRSILAWAVGCVLFVHCVIFIGVSYFGQIQMLWILTLAMIGSLSPASKTVRHLAVLCSSNGRENTPAVSPSRLHDVATITDFGTG